MRRPKKTTHNKGFTLIEIVVVIAIVAIVTSIAVVSWLHWHGHSEQRFSKDKLIATLNAKRLLALNSRDSYQCQVNGPTLICKRWTINKSGYTNWHDPVSKRVVNRDMTLKITQATPEKSQAIYFLASGEIPPFKLAVLKGKNRLFLLTTNGHAVVEAKEDA